jgi:hypothetical protein
MKKFNEYVDKVYKEGDDDWFSRRMDQFRRAANGEKGAIEGQPGTKVPRKPVPIYKPITPPPKETPEEKGPSITDGRILTADQVKGLGLTPDHNLVWNGSMIDARGPGAAYPYIFNRLRKTYRTNPFYHG